MSRSLWWRFLLVSLAFALMLSLVYVVLVRETTGSARAAVQRSVSRLLANALETGPYPESMARLDAMLAESPEMPSELWVVRGTGDVIASRSGMPLPEDFADWDMPARVHEVKVTLPAWQQGGLVTVTRLRDDAPTYLVTRNARPGGRPVLRYQTVFFVITLVAAIFLGLSLVTLYMRMRSREARAVLLRLTSGDLRARFDPGRLDAVGELMHEFNHMADEIERLVARLRQAEDARRGMLQELGHDLRTPLTSLRTSVETLSSHGGNMPAEDRDAFLGIARSELDYFVRLIDDLFFIADIAEPRYRHSTQQVDLAQMLASEIKALESRRAPGQAPAWQARLIDETNGQASVEGDRVLLARLLRNALDNAAKHARQVIDIRLSGGPRSIEVTITDDGPGMSEEQLSRFGTRRSQRLHTDAGQPAMSLGLGSVIMRTIVALHGGRLEVGRIDPAGTRVVVSLPRSGQAAGAHTPAASAPGLPDPPRHGTGPTRL